MSSDEFEQENVDLFEENLLEQAVDFNTRGESLLDIALHRNCLINAATNKYVNKIND